VTRLPGVPTVFLAAVLLAGCGGDDTVNPTDPEAGPVKSGDAGGSGDGSKPDASPDGPQPDAVR
jgi:hypothetical protein